MRIDLRVYGVTLILMALAVTGPAVAGGKYKKSETPVFPEAQPGRALVYFVRGTDTGMITVARRLRVLLDETPVGHLGRRTYLAVQVEPGDRVLWGPLQSTPTRFTFVEGETYALRMVIEWAATQAVQSSAWEPIELTALRGTVVREKLAHVTPTEKGLKDLRKQAAKHATTAIANARRARPTAVVIPIASVSLPQTFEKVAYRPEKRGFGFTTWKARGTLTVTSDVVRFESKKITESIPVGAIRSVAVGMLGADKYNDWVIIEYLDEGVIQFAGFMYPFGPEAMQRIHASLQTAIDDAGLAPLQRVERAVASAEQFEVMGSMNASDPAAFFNAQDAADGVRTRLHDVDRLLSEHLESVPDDIGALFLQVRLDRALAVLSPVVISGGEVQKDDPLGPKRDPQRTLDRILEMDPGNHFAQYMKARLYGITDWQTGMEKDLAQALHYARLAVQGDPFNPVFAEALALYLISDGREADARQVFEEAETTSHPIYRLLGDRAKMPVPDDAFEMQEFARIMAQREVAVGAIRDYGPLRVQVFGLMQGAHGYESFCRERWPGFELHETGPEESDEGVMSAMHVAQFEWDGDRLVPDPFKPDEESLQKAEVALIVIQYRDPSEEIRERLHAPDGDLISQIILFNRRDLTYPQERSQPEQSQLEQPRQGQP